MRKTVRNLKDRSCHASCLFVFFLFCFLQGWAVQRPRTLCAHSSIRKKKLHLITFNDLADVILFPSVQLRTLSPVSLSGWAPCHIWYSWMVFIDAALQSFSRVSYRFAQCNPWTKVAHMLSYNYSHTPDHIHKHSTSRHCAKFKGMIIKWSERGRQTVHCNCVVQCHKRTKRTEQICTHLPSYLIT